MTDTRASQPPAAANNSVDNYHGPNVILILSHAAYASRASCYKRIFDRHVIQNCIERTGFINASTYTNTRAITAPSARMAICSRAGNKKNSREKARTYYMQFEKWTLHIRKKKTINKSAQKVYPRSASLKISSSSLSSVLVVVRRAIAILITRQCRSRQNVVSQLPAVWCFYTVCKKSHTFIFLMHSRKTQKKN